MAGHHMKGRALHSRQVQPPATENRLCPIRLLIVAPSLDIIGGQAVHAQRLDSCPTILACPGRSEVCKQSNMSVPSLLRCYTSRLCWRGLGVTTSFMSFRLLITPISCQP